MTEARLSLGRQGEEAAARFLERLGMRILARNHRTPVGELDLVASHRGVLAFVEVKTRRGTACGTPAEAVGPRKQRQIVRAAMWYLNDHPGLKLQPRFDVVAVLATDDGLQVEHIPGAFEA